MNFFIRLCLQVPLTCFLNEGVKKLTDHDEWYIYLPISIGLCLLYDLGEYLRYNQD